MLETTKPTPVVRVYDPAINDDPLERGGCDLLAYTRKRDYATLKFRHGALPVIFHVRRISVALWDGYVQAGVTEDERRSRAFQAAVVRVENRPQPDGSRVTWTPERTEVNGRHVPMTEDETQSFAPADRYEIGEVAWSLCFFPSDCAVSFRLPPTSLLCWQSMDSQCRAVSDPTAVATTSDDTKAAPQA